MNSVFKHSPVVCIVLYMVAIMLWGARACASAQSATTTTVAMAFEVATIKPAAPFDPTKFGPRVSLSRASYTDMSLRYLISYAYDIKMPQVSGPEKTVSAKYDIVAILPEGAAKEDEKKMLQVLLKERFGLAFHIEKREGEVYALRSGNTDPDYSPPLPICPSLGRTSQPRTRTAPALSTWVREGP